MAFMASLTESWSNFLIGSSSAETSPSSSRAALAALAASLLPSRRAICSALRSEAPRPAARVSRTASVSAVARPATADSRSEVSSPAVRTVSTALFTVLATKRTGALTARATPPATFCSGVGDERGGATEGLLGEHDGQPLDGRLVGGDELLGELAHLGLARPGRPAP